MITIEEAASEQIAVVLLIAIFAAAAAVVGLVVLSTHPGSAPPAMLVHLDNDSLANNSIVLYHDGGDPLERGHFMIRVNGVDRTSDFTLIYASGVEGHDWTTWTTGQALVLHDLPATRDLDIQIVADGVDGAGTEWLLHDLGNGTAIEPTVTPTTEPTPAPLTADFTADPMTGTAPLTVRFTDRSTGGPTAWSWNFGDGETSTVQNPAHTYDTPGTYTVSLTVRDDAKNSDTKTQTIIVTAPPAEVHGIILITSPPKGGTLIDGGTLAFTVTGPWSLITVDGTTHPLSHGDLIKLTLIDDQKGTFYVTRNTVTDFAFPNVQVMVNDEIVGEGAIDFGNIWISGYDDLASTLTLLVPSETAWTSLVVDGRPVIQDWEDRHGIVLENLMPDSTGVMNLDLTSIGPFQHQVFYQGGAESYVLVKK